MSTFNTKHLLGVLISVTLLLGFSSQVFAVGTPSGTAIDNQATLTFSVGGTPQVPVTSDDPNQGGANDPTRFIVDTRIDVTVAWQDAANVQVAPGQDGVTPVPNPPAVLEFLVTNVGNADQDYALSFENGGADDFDPTAVQIFVDNGNGVYEPGIDNVTFIDELSSVAGVNTATVFVVGSISAAQTNGQLADLILVATTHDAGGGGVQGPLTAEDAGNDVILGPAQNVFADAAGDAVVDIITDGEHSDTGTYVVIATTVTVTKTSLVVADGLGNTNPVAKAIPGATVTYTISIANTGGLAATTIAATDPIDVANLTFAGNVTFDAGCGAPTASGFASPNFTFSVGTIAAGATCNVTFDVTIN